MGLLSRPLGLRSFPRQWKRGDAAAQHEFSSVETAHR